MNYVFSIIKKNGFICKTLFCIVILFAFTFCESIYAENINMSFSYGVNNIARNGEKLPIEVYIENRDDKDFNGSINISTFENNNSVFVYKKDVAVGKKERIYVSNDISINNGINTIIVEILNNKGEIVTIDRKSIDLSTYDDMMIVGAITSDYKSLSYIDNLSFNNNTISLKLVELTEDLYKRNNNVLDCVDMLLVSDYDLTKLSDGFNNEINRFINSSKPFLLMLGKNALEFSIPDGIKKYFKFPIKYHNGITDFSFLTNSRLIDLNGKNYIRVVNDDNIILICSSISGNELSYDSDNKNILVKVYETVFSKDKLERYTNRAKLLSINDYYNISNLLNMIDKIKLPDIFKITIAIVFYISFMTIILYVYLRNNNKRELYGRYVFIFSIIFTFIMMIFGLSIMRKNTFLTYISIVDISGQNIKERAFLNFRTSESGSYTFNTSKENKLFPVLKDTREPIISLEFLDTNSIKTTEIEDKDNRKVVAVKNARDFDSNVFIYENSNYLNDIYNVECSISKFDGDISGRITNNMNVPIKDASILLFGNVIRIGDIDSNRSMSLSRQTNYGAPIGNNSMLAEMLGNDNNFNILKYYLDENVDGYYDYALLFGFIENNGTLDLNSSDVGDVYGRTLIVNKIPIDKKSSIIDLCSLENDVLNISGYYDNHSNSISGETDVVNSYSFSPDYLISKLYFEDMYNYDHGSLTSNVPFYGDIYVLNMDTKSYDYLHDKEIGYDDLPKYLDDMNSVTIKFVPSSRDPLYRNISLPILRAIGSK